MAWTNWSQTWSTRSTITTSRRPLQRRRKYLRLQADPRLKQNQEDLQIIAHLQGLYLFLKEHGLILNQELNSIKLTQWQKEQTLFFDTENYLEKKMGRSNSGEWKMIFRTNLSTLSIGLMMYGRARWQEAEITIIDFKTVLTISGVFVRTRNFFFTVCPALQGHSGRLHLIDPSLQVQCINSVYFLRVHLSYWMCGQFALHHKFRIDSGRTKF